MDFFRTQNHTPPPKRNKKRLTQDQVSLLESSFSFDKKLEPDRRLHLARELGLPPRQVAIWYQNKRARWKTQSLELNYNALEQRLDNALADKRRLEREIGRLRGELEKSKEMVIALTPPPYPVSSASGDEVGSSSLPDDANFRLENAGVLQVEELYACLMGVDNQTGKFNDHDLFA
ncbi:hypothetical protein HHK36_005257 [Tetracentron sinense]|uniref:Homeobox-leucine zipper protein n=1 Tax=Tetracentron sinense TaxID=13715 RepID=A0A835DM71_TETSI|nr:hypothetical protein HHK36_005257 [Tetracentron sinense]